MKRRGTLVAGAIAIIVLGDAAMGADKPIIEVSTWLGEQVTDFVRRHDAASRSDNLRQNPSFWYEVASGDPAHTGVQLRYREGACDYAFPPGRFLQVAQDAGVVNALTAVLPLTVLTFEEARALAEDIRTRVNAAGWEETRWYGDVSREKVANNPGEKSAWAGKWRPCGKVGQEAGLSIKDAGMEYVGTSVPLNAQKRVDPVKPGGEYLLVLEIYRSIE